MLDGKSGPCRLVVVGSQESESAGPFKVWDFIVSAKFSARDPETPKAKNRVHHNPRKTPRLRLLEESSCSDI